MNIDQYKQSIEEQKAYLQGRKDQLDATITDLKVIVNKLEHLAAGKLFKDIFTKPGKSDIYSRARELCLSRCSAGGK